MKRVFFYSAVLALAGCATIVTGTSQEVRVDTPGHPGAQCVLSSAEVTNVTVTTPATANVPRSKHNISVTCTKGCYRGKGVIPSYVEAMAAGNVLLGGVIGAGIDAASGALNKYEPDNKITMTRSSRCG